MNRLRGSLIALGFCAALAGTTGCSHHHHGHREKTTRKVTIEGPEKKTEVKIERTDKKD